MNIESWLGSIYKADNRNHKTFAMADFKVALGNDAELKTAAEARLKELDALIAARGELACAYSTKYRTYLQEALG
jgi:hypothetical protein